MHSSRMLTVGCEVGVRTALGFIPGVARAQAGHPIYNQTSDLMLTRIAYSGNNGKVSLPTALRMTATVMKPAHALLRKC